MTKTAELLAKLVHGLNFLSETDDIWQVFSPSARRKGAITSKTMTEITGLEFDRTLDFEDFLNRTTNSQTISQGQAVGKRYRELHKELRAMLVNRQVFKMVNSPRNYEYYVVGLDRDNNLVGVFVTSVET